MNSKERKHRFVVIIDKEVFEDFKKLAKEQNRSASNLASKILSDYVKDNKHKLISAIEQN